MELAINMKVFSRFGPVQYLHLHEGQSILQIPLFFFFQTVRLEKTYTKQCTGLIKAENLI